MTDYELLIFDWDGTLMDSTALIALALQESCRELGLDVPDDEAAKFVIGLGTADTLRLIAPGLDAEGQRRLTERYRVHFLAGESEIPLYAGVKEMLEDLSARGARLGIATGKARRGLDRALQATGLARHFEITRCADEGFSKPHPGMLLHIFDSAAVPPGRALMIGDTTHDLELAANAGCDALAVCYGAHSEARLRSMAARDYLSTVDALHRWLTKQT
jgi:phosphoglycolate phosphatase